MMDTPTTSIHLEVQVTRNEGPGCPLVEGSDTIAQVAATVPPSEELDILEDAAQESIE